LEFNKREIILQKKGFTLLSIDVDEFDSSFLDSNQKETQDDTQDTTQIKTTEKEGEDQLPKIETNSSEEDNSEDVGDEILT